MSRIVVIALPGLLLAVGLASSGPCAIGAPLFAAQFLSFDIGNYYDYSTSVAICDLNRAPLAQAVAGVSG